MVVPGWMVDEMILKQPPPTPWELLVPMPPGHMPSHSGLSVLQPASETGNALTGFSMTAQSISLSASLSSAPPYPSPLLAGASFSF